MHRALYKFPFIVFFFLFITNNLFAQPASLGKQGQLKWLLWENVSDDELDDLTHLQAFPNHPSAHEIITGLKSNGSVSQVEVEGNFYESVQYGSTYGSLVRGYLTVPATGNYQFNLTGDDEVKFFLSTDDTKANLMLRSSIDTWTYRKEFAKAIETNQTSANISLTTGNYYYFELWHKEHSGGDHFEVLWKTPTNTTTWEDIPSTNLYDYTDLANCPPNGTACDDGNANTINDLQDGFCNCVGTPTSLSACVGSQGAIKALYYLDLDISSSMSNFLAAEKYPLMPDTAEILDLLQGPITETDRDYFGTKIAGFLKVPVTGAYQFNVTCDDRASFALSTDDTPDNLVELSFSNFSNEHEHYRYTEQIQAAVTLNKDNFYYFEMHHREGGGGDRFSAYWRTPFTQDTLWRYIDKAYIYGYGCEMACIPEGTPCDDNNNFTNNDQYDADCNCVGTPCRDCDETPALDYTPTEVCGVSDKTDNTAVNAWESCTPQAHPTSGRGTNHWIQYDLGKTYLLTESHIWNYNVAGATGNGFKDVVIDYSLDGTNWTQLGDMMQWTQATGAIGYEGFIGPNFNGISARYILITALNNWTGNGVCSGFSKITFQATECLLMGQSCDDGDPNSVNDLYDANCNCIGEGEGFSPCGTIDLMQENIVLSTNEYRATKNIQSRGMVNTGSDIKMIAGNSVTLLDGFHAVAGSSFLAAIGDCEAVFAAKEEETTALDLSRVGESDPALKEESNLSVATLTTFDDLGVTNLKVWPNPTNSWTAISFNLPYQTTASLCIYATDGRKVICLANNNDFVEGAYTKEFPAQRLAAGMYYIVLKTDTEVLTESLVVIE